MLIKSQEAHFPDGQLPSKDLIKKWLATVDEFFSNANNTSAQTAVVENGRSTADHDDIKPGNLKMKGDKVEERRIGVHCVAGLGRAPFFVAIALVNNGCSASNAIELIRKNRPGALNLT